MSSLEGGGLEGREERVWREGQIICHGGPGIISCGGRLEGRGIISCGGEGPTHTGEGGEPKCLWRGVWREGGSLWRGGAYYIGPTPPPRSTHRPLNCLVIP